MPERRLLIDLGNSRLKWVWARGADLEIETAGEGGARDFERALGGDGPNRPATILLSSVAGNERTAEVAGICRTVLGREPIALASQREQCGVRNGYREPARLGVDRWLALLGAVHHYGKPIVVWDLGTASTLDAVDAGGRHLGGLILPGPAIMLDSLREHTLLDDSAGLVASGGLQPGRSTGECIRQGILAAQAGAARQFLAAVSSISGTDYRLVATGGAAEKAAGLLEPRPEIDPWLVFRGMTLL